MQRLEKSLSRLNIAPPSAKSHYGQYVVESQNLISLRTRIRKELWLDKAILGPINGLLCASSAQGLDLVPVSGFRTYEYQENLIKRGMERGMSLEKALMEWMPPGFSEHHSGLAIDFSTKSLGLKLSAKFDGTLEFQWLKDNAHKYGFYMSYPQNNKFGVIYEPWHWKLRKALPQ